MRFPRHFLTDASTALLLAATAGSLTILPGPAGARPDLFAVSPYTSYPAACGDRIGSPRLSPSATRVAFVHCFDPVGTNRRAEPQLFIARVDGTGLVQVTGNGTSDPAEPVWSLDGALLYFTAITDAPPRRELFRVNAAGGTPERLTVQAGPAGFRDIVNPAPVTGGVWFATGADLLGEGLSLRSDERNFYRLAGGTLTRITSAGVHPVRQALLFGLSADGSVAAFSAEDPQLPGSRPLRPFKLQASTAAVTPLTPDGIGSTAIAGQLSAIGGTVVFQAAADYTGMNGDRLNQLFRVSTGGGTVEQLTSVNAPGATAPSVDAQGNLVTFETTASIFIGESNGTPRVYALAGGQMRRISTGRNASVSLDGSRITYVDTADSTGGNSDRSPEIYSVRPDGTDRKRHSGFVAGASSGADISTDGEWVTFQSSADLDGGNPGGNTQVYVARPDGSGLKRLTAAPPGREAREPSLSAGGSHVVFASNADLVTNQNFDHNYEIFRVRRDGTELTQITRSSSGVNSRPMVSAGGDTVAFITTADIVAGAQLGSGRVAVWRKNGGFALVTPASDRVIDTMRMSDKGDRIALLTAANLDNRNPLHSLIPFTVSVTGGFLTSVQTPGPAQPGGFDLSPGGQSLAIAFLDGKLALIPYAGGTPDTVFAETGVVATLPAVSSEGRFLAFSVLSQTGSFRRGDFYRLERATGAVTAMLEAPQPLPVDRPAITGDGRKLAFTLAGVDTLNPDGSREIFTAVIAATPVRLLELAAARGADGRVTVSWRISDDELAAAWRIERADGDGDGDFAEAARIDGGGDRHAWVDETPPPGRVRYRLTSVDRDGTAEVLGIAEAHGILPIGPRLTASPNPMTPTTLLTFSLPAPGRAELRVVDVSGRLVRTLFDGPAAAGRTEVAWDGRSDRGERLGSGVYYATLNGTSTVSIILVR